MLEGVLKSVKQLYPKLSKCHKKIAKLVLHDSEKVSVMTAHNLAKTADVSESTVMRFVAFLGYEGYLEFQAALVESVNNSLTFLGKVQENKKPLTTANLLKNVLTSDINRLQNAITYLDRDIYEKSVKLITHVEKIYIVTDSSAEHIAELFSHNLSLIFDNVIFIPSSSLEIWQRIYPINKRDLLIVFSFPRYSSQVTNAVRYAKHKLADIIAFTESIHSPIASYTENLLLVESETPFCASSYVVLLSLINALTFEIFTRKEKSLRSRFDAIEKMYQDYDNYGEK